MSGHSAAFVGSVPKYYDEGLGPVIFADYAVATAQRVAAQPVSRVLETACETGIVTRALRDALPVVAHLTATDLNTDMMNVAPAKVRPAEAVEFQTADGTMLPFADGAFDTMVCQFGMMFYPNKGFREAHRVLKPGGRYLFSVWDAHRHNPFGRIAHAVIGSFFPADPPQLYAVPFSYHAVYAPLPIGMVQLRQFGHTRPDDLPIPVCRRRRPSNVLGSSDIFPPQRWTT